MWFIICKINFLCKIVCKNDVKLLVKPFLSCINEQFLVRIKAIDFSDNPKSGCPHEKQPITTLKLESFDADRMMFHRTL